MAERPETYEQYFLARQALWAGDVRFARDRLESLTAAGQQVERTDPESVVRWRAGKLRDFLAEHEFEEPGEEFVVATEHLRGVFHRTSTRGFEMRAFLLDPEWDEELLRRSHDLAVERLRTESDATEARGPRRDVAASRDVQMHEDETTSWIDIHSDALVEVAVSELALVRARLLWTHRRPPGNLEVVRASFQVVLDEIEAGRPMGDPG